MVLYLIKRGEIWQTLVGKNLHGAQENFAKSINALLPGTTPEEGIPISQKDAVQNLTAIYGDFQVRRLIIFCVLAVFGAISALVTAAFLIKQTTVMDRQTFVMDQQSKIMDKQTQFAIDMAKTEALYKPYWQVKHADSKEARRAAFTQLLQQQETKNFNGIRLDEIDFTPADGMLTVEGFHCKSCQLSDVEFSKVNWEGDFQIQNSFLRKTTFRGGTMQRPIFIDVQVSNDGKDQQGTYRREVFFEAMNVESFLFRDSVLKNARLVGYPAGNLDLLAIEGAQNSLFSHVTFEDIRIINVGRTHMPFDKTRLENVEIKNSSITGINFSSAFISGTLTLDNANLENVTFSEKHRPCIKFLNTKQDGVSWAANGVGACISDGG